MNQHGEVAIGTYSLLIQNEKSISPEEAWLITAKTFNINSNKHDCPRNAFLGLYESKLLLNISTQPIITRTINNKYYALVAVQILLSDGRISKNSLLNKMNEIIGFHRTQYGDVADVVLALWDAKYIIKEIDLSEEIERLRKNIEEKEKLRKKINPSIDDLLGDLDI